MLQRRHGSHSRKCGRWLCHDDPSSDYYSDYANRSGSRSRSRSQHRHHHKHHHFHRPASPSSFRDIIGLYTGLGSGPSPYSSLSLPYNGFITFGLGLGSTSFPASYTSSSMILSSIPPIHPIEEEHSRQWNENFSRLWARNEERGRRKEVIRIMDSLARDMIHLGIHLEGLHRK